MTSHNIKYCFLTDSVKPFMVIVFLLMTIGASAQKFTLTGKLTDDKGEPLEFATVAVPSQAKVTMTNLKGEYTLSLQSADSVVVRFSMVGFKTKTRVLRNPKGKQTLLMQMYSDNQLDELVVTETRRQTTQTDNLKVEDMKQAVSVTGNAVEDMIQMQAGVSSHSELSSQYNVRGGSFDENSVYINNVEVYRPFLVRCGQQEGISIINPDMVESVGFSSGGFEAMYGDKMSSALDIKYRRPKKFEANLTGSLLGGSAFIGFSTKKFSWSNGVRYKRTSALLSSMDTKGEYDPDFLDIQTYLTFSPNKRWDITFLGNIQSNNYNFLPKDRETTFGTLTNAMNFKVYFDGKEEDKFRTYFGTLGITHHIGKKTDLSLHLSGFQTQERETYDIQGQYWLNETEASTQLGVGTYMEHTRNYVNARILSAKLMLSYKAKKHSFLGGITIKSEHVEEQSREYEMRDSAQYSVPHTGTDLKMIYALDGRNTLDATRIEAFAQDTYRFTSKGRTYEDGTEAPLTLYTLNYGVRFSNWSFNKESIVSPRASLAITPSWSQNSTFRFAAGMYYQAPFFKELRDTVTTDGVTTVHLNNKIKSQCSVHFIAAYDHRFTLAGRKFRFSAEAYYKLLSNLIPYSVNNVKVVYYGKNNASGHAAGVDLKLYGEFVPGSDSWLTFSWMNTSQNVNGTSIPLPTDQRYAINLYFTDYFPGTTRWKASVKICFADGLPFSTPHKSIEKNTFRAPSYLRCDVGMTYRLLNNEDRSKHGFLGAFKNIWLGVDCLNVFGKNNVNSYYWITDITNQQYAVPNYLTGRQLNARLQIEF